MMRERGTSGMAPAPAAGAPVRADITPAWKPTMNAATRAAPMMISEVARVGMGCLVPVYSLPRVSVVLLNLLLRQHVSVRGHNYGLVFAVQHVFEAIHCRSTARQRHDLTRRSALTFTSDCLAHGERQAFERHGLLRRLCRDLRPFAMSDRQCRCQGQHGDSRPVRRLPEYRHPHFFCRFTLSSPALRPLASFNASSFAQKCMNRSRGCSSSMWLCNAVTSMPLSRSAFITAFTSEATST